MKSLNGVAVAAAWSVLALGGIAHAQEAVQWRVEDGGNGHWYSVRCIEGGINWSSARAECLALGGDLATLTTPAEHGVVVLGLAESLQCGQLHIGGWKQGQEWGWITGEPFEFAPWDCGTCAANECQPDIGCEDRLAAMCPVGDVFYLNNIGKCFFGGITGGYIIEWSADCNGDGIVDYGQILDGTFEDANTNGVPDCCDEGVDCDPCLGDVNFDGQVNGADISVLLGFWGLNGKPVAADITQDGLVDGADLAVLLGNWGPCE
jgi:hypothetical protein